MLLRQVHKTTSNIRVLQPRRLGFNSRNDILLSCWNLTQSIFDIFIRISNYVEWNELHFSYFLHDSISTIFQMFKNCTEHILFISMNHHRWSMFFQSSRDSGSIRPSASITGQLSNRLIICSHVLKERSTFTSKVLPMSRSCRNICSQATQSFSWY